MKLDIKTDASAVLAAIDEARRLLTKAPQGLREVVVRLFDLPDFTAELVRFQVDRNPASGTGDLFVTLYPSDRFRDFLAALRAGKIDGFIVEKGHDGVALLQVGCWVSEYLVD